MVAGFEVDQDRIYGLTQDRTIPTQEEVENILCAAAEGELPDSALNRLLNAVRAPDFPAIKRQVLEVAGRLRRGVHGDRVVVMAPIEVSNRCASECYFCGWRASNGEMMRVSLDRELVQLQAKYLIEKGIYHIELVSGDDIGFVRHELPDIIRDIRRLFPPGIKGTIWFCTLALADSHYRALRECGADGIVVWQETYDPELYRRYITRGPKAFGIDEEFRIVRGGDGYRFRLTCQDRALAAGLQVALGSMLGFSPHLNFEVLATVTHARHLMSSYGIDEQRPLVIGMPIWNHITTPSTDNRPETAASIEPFFSYLAALYFLALDRRRAWIFPNCRVSLPVQAEAVATSGVFTSTEVKVGPGGYLPSLLRGMDEEQRAGVHALLRRNLRQHYRDDMELSLFLDRVEQFRHHYHTHEEYLQEFARAGLRPVVA